MTFRRKVDYTQTIINLNLEISEFSNWKALLDSTHGKFLLEFLNKAMEETMLAPDVDTDFRSVRSKYQTLKAIRDKMMMAESEIAWRQKEVAKLNRE